MKRRVMLGHTALAAFGVAFGAFPRQAAGQTPSGPDALILRARALAERPHDTDAASLPPPFDSLDYDRYRAITPRAGAAAGLDIGGGFRADLLPPGWLFSTPVQISLPGRRAQTDFDPGSFEFDARYFPQGAPVGPFPGLGHSGLRIRYPLNAPDRLDDLIVLQGASYFRALARDVAYGLSARGLALGTGGPAPEEFPVTREIEVFDTQDGVLHFGCLIDSPRAAAAFIVSLRPGNADSPATVMRCDLHLFVRETVSDIGIAPLTSMFQHNDMGPARIDDFRPAVHDSAVLVMENGAGEGLWRPLANPDTVQMSAFQDAGPRRFGLLQIPDSFAAFRDAEGAYHRRPSAFVEPLGDWGAGAVQLLEIPTPNEYADNIVAFWRPAAPLQPGVAHHFAYDLRWAPAGLAAMPPAQSTPLVAVHSASGVNPENPASRLFVIDYAAAGDGGLPDPADLDLFIAQPEGAEISGQTLYRIDGARPKLRASFVLIPSRATNQAELRVQLRGAGRDVAPVWLYRWGRTANGGP
ncbi:glucans biosynthesis protein [Roseinatronobacter thiooxidans]|uniref:Glucans biosynthesis protein n=1 Tax=Roseinatronobacter thiooxidans TaxID=121821 RepID=A0A2W7QCH7_9RHOB|nr:glucan biosynthesis protein [Roseinatronobacter thiooxidans]PZX45911.1 glucans biosynthesis protein [Roseinatronobacter thiooxidans]